MTPSQAMHTISRWARQSSEKLYPDKQLIVIEYDLDKAIWRVKVGPGIAGERLFVGVTMDDALVQLAMKITTEKNRPKA